MRYTFLKGEIGSEEIQKEMLKLVNEAEKGDTLLWNERIGTMANLDEIKREACQQTAHDIFAEIEKNAKSVWKLPEDSLAFPIQNAVFFDFEDLKKKFGVVESGVRK